ncbi:MAG: glycosyltransferase [Patulibacter minatonensis]
MSRPRILVFTMPTSGHVNPLLPVLRTLVERGAEVFCTSIPAFDDRIADLGARPIPYLDGLAERAEQPASGLPEIIERLAVATADAYEWSLGLIDEHRPDVVLVDSIVPWGRLAAAERGVPCVTSCTTFVVHSGLDSDWRMKLDLVKELAKGAKHMVGWARARRRFTKRYGADPGDPVEMLGGRADRTFAYVSRDLQPGGELVEDDVEFVGSAVRPADPNHPDLADLPDGPLIYISLGTRLNDRPDFLRSCLEAFADHPGPVLLSIGHRTPAEALGTLPANAIVRTSVPQLAVLARCELFITHGGMNSTCESLVHGVPMIVYPQTADQPRVAARIEEVGAGVYLRGKNPSPAEIRAAAAEARQGAMRKRAAELGAGLMQGGGTERAAELVLEMAGVPLPTGASTQS